MNWGNRTHRSCYSHLSEHQIISQLTWHTSKWEKNKNLPPVAIKRSRQHVTHYPLAPPPPKHNSYLSPILFWNKKEWSLADLASCAGAESGALCTFSKFSPIQFIPALLTEWLSGFVISRAALGKWALSRAVSHNPPWPVPHSSMQPI